MLESFFKKRKIFLLFVTAFLFSFLYTFFLNELSLDEVWNYGFGYNISKGLLPYGDFNIVILPLFPFLVSIFIKLFGNYLFSMHILNSLMIATMVTVMYKRLGKKVVIVFFLLLICSYPSYNLFTLFLMILILTVNESDSPYQDYIIPFLIGLLFLTKHSIGITCLLPYFLYSNHKMKGVLAFLIPILLCGIYLIATDTLLDCINYCFLGMFDFATQNHVLIFLPFEIIVLIILIRYYIKSSFRDRDCFYVIMYQVVTVPLFDFYHFMIGFCLFIYYILSKKEIPSYRFKYYVFISLFVPIYICCSKNIYTNILFTDDKHYYLYQDSSSYLYGRHVNYQSVQQLEVVSDYLNSNTSKYDSFYIISANSYFIKLYNHYDLDKFDLINCGNMGYHGSFNYIQELENICGKKKCLFIKFPDEYKKTAQTSKEIWKWISQKYKKIDQIAFFDVYES